MKDAWPDYANSVDFYAVGIDPTEDIRELISYRDTQGHPWPVAVPGEGMLSAFRVAHQSTKIGLGSTGVIRYREGFGRGTKDMWRNVFEELAATR